MRTSAGGAPGRNLRSVAVWIAASLAASMFALAGRAAADMYTDYFELAQPGHLTSTPFGAAYASPSYYETHEGVEFEQTLTRRLGMVARLTAYQQYHGSAYDTPIPPPSRAPFYFGRFEGGVDLNPMYGAHLIVLGGHDAGDSHSTVMEESGSVWMNVHSAHPISISVNSSHYFENSLTNGLVDLRTIALSTDKLMLLVGAGAIIWGGRTVQGSAKGEAGPDISLFIRDWKLRMDLQAGYGSDQEYGTLSFSRSFDWEE
jgi:hypothetical protein